MGASKQLHNEVRDYENPNPMEIMQQLIDCTDEVKQDKLVKILARCEPMVINNPKYFHLLIQTPLQNLNRVWVKYGTYGIGHTIRKSWSDEIHNKILELENQLPEKTLHDIFAEKCEIADEKNLQYFIFKFKGNIYFADYLNKWSYTEIQEL